MLHHALQLYVLLNFVTKAALALAETTLASQFQHAYGAAGSLDFFTAGFIFSLGVLGLAPYAYLIACAKRSDRLEELNALLQASLVATAAGSALFMCAPLAIDGRLGAAAEGRVASLSLLSVGGVLVWSLGGPVADCLTASGLSVLISQHRPRRSQARAMAYISAAGSLGRIAFPALLGPAGLAGAWAVSAAATLACLLAMWAFNAAFADTLAEGGAGGGEEQGPPLLAKESSAFPLVTHADGSPEKDGGRSGSPAPQRDDGPHHDGDDAVVELAPLLSRIAP